MKKILLVGILTILCVSATFAQVRFGATAGLNVSNIIESGEQAESGDFKAGLKVGVLADYAITGNFSVIPELLFSQRGSKISEPASMSTTINYLQLPINAAYKFDVGYGSKIFIFAGPYLGYAVSGKYKIESLSVDIPFGSGDEDMKRFDFGLNGGIGYQYDKIFLKLQYNQGLTGLYNVSHTTSKNQNIAVSAGYFFK